MMKFALFMSLMGGHLGCMGMEKAPELLRKACERPDVEARISCRQIERYFWCTQALAGKPVSRGALLACNKMTHGGFRDDGSPGKSYADGVSWHVADVTEGESAAFRAGLIDQTLNQLNEMRQKDSNQKGT